MRPPMFIPFKNLFVQSNNTVEKKITKRHGLEGSIAIVDCGKYFKTCPYFIKSLRVSKPTLRVFKVAK